MIAVSDVRRSAQLGFTVPGEFPSLDPNCAADALAGADAPAPAKDSPPSWLRPEQVGAFRAALGAARAFGCAMIATPVGSGKTYLGLAVCCALDLERPIDAVVPAILTAQWQRTVADLAIRCRLTSHEALSRGGTIAGVGPVLIDESHRFRNPSTRRYRELAPQLLGRAVVLLTATPVVNRRGDLSAQLGMAVRDDALALYGTPSLRLAVATSGDARLAPLMVRSTPAPDRPLRRDLVVRSWHEGDPAFHRAVGRVDRLRLSRSGPIAALIRGGLLRALGSSPAALLASLDGYRQLLTHAAQAHQAGHPLNRATIQAVVAGDADQLVMWDLIGTSAAAADLAVGDRARVHRLVAQTRRWIQAGDAKAARLAAILADRKPTLVFATYTETVRHLRRRLAGTGIAWLTGSEAGYQQRRMPRSLVLQSFDPIARGKRELPVTTVLLATDVAAEGLNLRGAARIIHYDLPWTPIRLEQRDGRALRSGSPHPDIEVVRFELPAPIEARIGVEEILASKRQLSRPAPRASLPDEACRVGFCRVAGDEAAAVFRLRSLASGATGRLVLTRSPDRPWQDTRDAAVPCLQWIRGEALCPAELARILASLAEPVRRAIGRIDAARSGTRPIPAGALAAVRAEIARCHRNRDAAGLATSEAILRFLRRGHTAGEAMLADRIAAGDRRAFELASRIGAMEPDEDAVVAEIVVLALPVGACPGDLPTGPAYRPSDDVATFPG